MTTITSPASTAIRGELLPNVLIATSAISPQSLDPLLLGGKATALVRLYDEGFPIPHFVVLTTPGARQILGEEIWRQLQEMENVTDAVKILASVTMPPEIAGEVHSFLAREFPAGTLFAVRSSAVDEDSSDHSFAGQLSSYLNVPEFEVAERIVDVWRSAFTPSLYAYRQQRGLTGPPQMPAVLIQAMVAAESAGVAFSADPVSGRRGVAVVTAVHGLGDALVSGAQSGDSWQVGREGEILTRALLQPNQPSLQDEMVQKVAALARRCAAYFDAPQDIEWAVAQGELYLLQSRPITTLKQLSDPDGVYTVWDNSNIIESYGGMTTPLTFSFAKRAYQAVYQELCRILGVSRTTIQANQSLFANMIGLIHGRIYYNLLNWYRVLALLPGFKANRRFMEQMMGVKESLPAEVVATLAAATWRDRLVDQLNLARTIGGLLMAYLTLPKRQRNFYARLDRALGSRPPDLSEWRADELVAYYRRLESDLLPNWDAPLVNDFFAMIFYGLLRQLSTKWCDDADGSLSNELLIGLGGMVSAEPAERVRSMAEIVRTQQDETLVQTLAGDDRRAIARTLEAHPRFATAYRDYLDRFGERCLNELKLESPTLHDNPLPLLHAVAQLAQQPPLLDSNHGVTSASRERAEQQVKSALSGQPLRRLIFHWVLRNARERVVGRENLRFARTQVFGRARQILRTLGNRLYAAGVLADSGDLYYLTVDELCGWVEGTAVSERLGEIAKIRKEEYRGWADDPPLPSRFATYGAVYEGNRFEPSVSQMPSPAKNEQLLAAVAAAPGRAVGRARLVRDPLTARLNVGEIIVAEHTDPSWIMILPLAGALVVERGSLLSHAAIVARELGIPGVVAATGALQWLKEGEMVEVDGRAGTVRKL